MESQIESLVDAYDRDKCDPEAIAEMAEALLQTAKGKNKATLESLIASCRDRIAEREDD